MTNSSRRHFLKTTAISGASVASGQAASAASQTNFTKKNAMDHIVLVIFENRSFDNILGHLYAPSEVPHFDGVIGKDLSNPIPSWAQFPAPDGKVTYGVSTYMDAPNPDPGEEYPHTNTQLYNLLDERNRFKMGDQIKAPWNAPESSFIRPTMNGFVSDYISVFTAEMGRQPTYQEYSQIMTGYTPTQLPVINGLAKAFSCFDHWFCEVPSQTFANRSFWTAATSSSYVVNDPSSNFLLKNSAETIFNRLEAHGKTWKIYVCEPDPISFTGLINMPSLRKYFATKIVPFSEYETDCENGTLPNFALIEPNLISAHNDYHPAFGRALIQGVDLPVDPPSSVLGGEAFLSRIYNAYKGMGIKQDGANVLNTTLFIGWDEAGGTYDHVPAPVVCAPSPGAPVGQEGFDFQRSGYRVPAVMISPWIPEKTVFNQEFRHTSMIASVVKQWDLGKPFSQRDAHARTLQSCFTLTTPRDPSAWPNPVSRPVPEYRAPDLSNMPPAYSGLATAMIPGLVQLAHAEGFPTPSMPKDPNGQISPRQGVKIALELAAEMFPLLAAKE